MDEPDDEPEVVPLLNTRRTVVLATLSIGVCGFAAMFSNELPFEGWRAVVALVLVIGCVPLSVVVGRRTLDADWWYTRRASKMVSRVAVYVVGGDAAFAAFGATLTTRQAGLFASMLLVLNSYLAGHFGTLRVVIAHCLFSSTVIVGFGVAMWQAGEADGAGVLARLLVVLIVVNGTTVGTHSFSLDVHHFVREHYAMASRDPLTGLLNRRGLQRAIESAPSSAERHVGVIVADIDHFKSVNDTQGHESGDSVITLFASRLERVVAVGGIVARIGGDEFCIVMLDATPETVRRVADTLLDVSQCWDDDIPITLSVGATSASGSAADLLLADAFRRADAALYRAKQLGRSRVEFAPEAEVTER